MHPKLELHLHPLCQDAIQKLRECHKVNKAFRLIGWCNTEKTDLDACLGEEFLVRRELNIQAGIDNKLRSEKIQEELVQLGV
mmetsp:Transcript_5148/g.15402  ORF Transcript_5148/g.15402 Transcript_5148/m.15402 type:complete len:82 (-) Transcript_5148:854-1099(-)